MEEDKALEIIRALAEGSDPYTGEVFGGESPYQNAQTVRALFTAIDALEAAARRKKRKRNLPERTGKADSASQPRYLSIGSRFSSMPRV